MKFELNRPTDYSDEAFINEIRRVSRIVEKPLTRIKFNKNSKYSASTLEKRFGSWINALKKAGLDSSYIVQITNKKNSSNKIISEEEIINELKRVSKILGKTCFSPQNLLYIQKCHEVFFRENLVLSIK